MAEDTRALMKRRMRRFGAQVIKAVDALPNSIAANVIAHQLIRSSCSVGSNYRSAQRPRSTADMIAKLKIVEEELDESLYWMELLVEAEISSKEHLKPHYQEGNELLAITVASIKTLRSKGSRISEQVVEYQPDQDSPFCN